MAFIHANLLSLAATLLLLVTTLLLLPLAKAAFDPLRAVPGPRWARYSRLWYLLNVAGGRFEVTNLKLHKELGPIVRFAPHQYSIDDPGAVKIIYGHATKFIKARWYEAWADKTVKELFSSRDPQIHAEIKRKVAHMYSMTSLLHYEPAAQRGARLFVERMTEFSRSRHSFDLQHWLQCYAFDVIADMTMSVRFGLLDDGEDTMGLLYAIHQFLIYSTHVGIYPSLHEILRTIMQKTLPSSGIDHVIAFVSGCITSRMKSNKEKDGLQMEHNDFLAKALKAHEEDSEHFSMNEVFTMCMNNIGAGSDTTSISLAAVLYNLVNSPDKLRKLREEIDEGACNFPRMPFTYHQAQSMPYLQACIKEALRLHPATGLPLVRVVPPEGATIIDTFFPGGTVVGINTWVAHYNEHVFGPNTAEFWPERWLQSKEKTHELDRYYFPFGLGSRMCIGKNISMMEISTLIPELVKRFDFQLVHPEGKLETTNVWFVKQKNLECTVSLRRL